MDEKEFQKYLEKRYQDQVDWYDRKAALNQKIYKRLQWVVIILSALTPVLVALEDSYLRLIAILISSMVAIITTALKTFQYQEHSINYRSTCEALKRERFYLDAKLGEYKTSDDVNALFVERTESIIAKENTTWYSLAQQNRTDPANQITV